MDSGFTKYEAFIRTVQLGRITAAAESLGYTQSAVSKMIASLEAEWKIKLLIRDKEGVRLSSEGRIIYEQMLHLRQEEQNLEHLVQEIRGLETGHISISAVASVGSHWLPDILQGFSAKYPAIDYEIEIGDYLEMEDWVSRGRADCAFLRLPTVGTFRTMEIGEDKMVAVVPKTHPMAAETALSLDMMCDDPFLLLDRGENMETIKQFRSRGLAPRVFLRTYDDSVVLAMVEKGIGVSVVQELSMGRMPYDVAVRPLKENIVRHIGIVWDPDNGSAALRKFLEYLETWKGAQKQKKSE